MKIIKSKENSLIELKLIKAKAIAQEYAYIRLASEPIIAIASWKDYGFICQEKLEKEDFMDSYAKRSLKKRNNCLN